MQRALRGSGVRKGARALGTLTSPSRRGPARRRRGALAGRGAARRARRRAPAGVASNQQGSEEPPHGSGAPHWRRAARDRGGSRRARVRAGGRGRAASELRGAGGAPGERST
jgi:hypothetical protein